jgi:uncharacterized membrane protein
MILNEIVAGSVCECSAFEVDIPGRKNMCAAITRRMLPDDDLADDERARFVQQLAHLMDIDGHDNNAGLQAYYFWFAMVLWLLSLCSYLAATTLMIAVLARRERRSKTVKTQEAAVYLCKF